MGNYCVTDRDECREMRAAQSEEDWDHKLYCNHHCVNIPGSYFCSCRRGFVLDENQHTCKAVCSDIVLTEDSGRIQTSEFPHSYSKLAECDWTIQVRDGLHINLIFDGVFDIEDHPDIEDCPYDALKIIYDGHEKAVCGQTAPNNGEVISTNTRTVKLTFTSDLAAEGRGFQMNYFTSRVQCPNRPTAPENGIFHSDAIEKTAYEFEDIVTYSCNAGFELIGEATLTCLSDGVWDHTPPTCQRVQCQIQPIENGIILSDAPAYEFEDIVTYSCNAGFELIGEATLTCLSDGTWDHEPPICEELGDDKCLMSELPLTADNGNLRCDKTVETSNYASSCQGDIQCPPNFISTGNAKCLGNKWRGACLPGPKALAILGQCNSSLVDCPMIDDFAVSIYESESDEYEEYEEELFEIGSQSAGGRRSNRREIAKRRCNPDFCNPERDCFQEFWPSDFNDFEATKRYHQCARCVNLYHCDFKLTDKNQLFFG